MRNNRNIKSFSIDYNWLSGRCAPNGEFCNANAQEYVKWNKELGCNNLWTFAVSYNGHSWYDSKLSPKIVGLNTDFLNDTVNIGHDEGLEVFAYMCLAANPVIALRHPEWTRNIDEDMFYMILCDDYLDYFCAMVKEVITVSNVDGLVFDWFRGASKKRTVWKTEEISQYNKLMDTPFDSENITEELTEIYEFRAIENAWRKIKRTIMETRDVKIWTNHPFDKINDPVWNGNILLKEVDYVLNESPNMELLGWIQSQLGEEAVLVQNLCGWEGHDLASMADKLTTCGMFGFAQADPKTCLPYTIESAESLMKTLDSNSSKDDKKAVEYAVSVAKSNAKNIEILRKIMR